jgi:two-component system phosphate regulon response regulator PhoB
MSSKILVVDDEPDLLEMVVLNLRGAGFNVITADNGALALMKARNEMPHLILLDLMLPQMNGIEVCKALKKHPATAHIPVIMLTAKSEEVDRIVGFEIGADDYVVKPCSQRELLLRVQSILRRGKTSSGPEEKITVGEMVIDHGRHEVTVRSKPIDLTATEFKLLAVLMERRGRVQSRERLLNDVWGYESVIDTRTVDTHVRRLREKLGKASDYIETVRGVGYRINDVSA